MLIGVKRLARPVDPLTDLAKALEAYPPKPPPDDDDGDDEPEAEIEKGLDREPGEA